jgi:hypothetical protein
MVGQEASRTQWNVAVGFDAATGPGTFRYDRLSGTLVFAVEFAR